MQFDSLTTNHEATFMSQFECCRITYLKNKESTFINIDVLYSQEQQDTVRKNIGW